MNAAGTTVIADNVRTNRSKGGVHQQRRCFLIDSLLEERQKQLAAAAAAAAETNRGQNGQIPGGKRVGKQEEWQKTEMTADGREEMLLARADTADQENDRREEDEEEGEGGGGEGMEMADEGAEGADEGQKKAILEALAKLVPILGEDKEELKRTGDRSIGSEREESHTVVGQHPHLPMAITSDFLQRLRFLQQQHSSTSSSVSPLACTWPAQTNPGSFNPANLRFPSFFPSPNLRNSPNYDNEG